MLVMTSDVFSLLLHALPAVSEGLWSFLGFVHYHTDWDMKSQFLSVTVDPVLVLCGFSFTIMLPDIWRAEVTQLSMFKFPLTIILTEIWGGEMLQPLLIQFVLCGFSLTIILADIWRARVLQSLLFVVIVVPFHNYSDWYLRRQVETVVDLLLIQFLSCDGSVWQSY
jgi:hypothetical protein